MAIGFKEFFFLFFSESTLTAAASIRLRKTERAKATSPSVGNPTKRGESVGRRNKYPLPPACERVLAESESRLVPLTRKDYLD